MVTSLPRIELTKEPALTEIGAAPAITGFHHFAIGLHHHDVNPGQLIHERQTGLDHISFSVAELLHMPS